MTRRAASFENDSRSAALHGCTSVSPKTNGQFPKSHILNFGFWSLGVGRLKAGIFQRPAKGLRDGCLAIVVACAVASAQQTARPSRIISLIPAVTEMLFAMGAGSQVVAVSSFDAYPPEVSKLPRVGALLDPNLENILALRPDLVATYGSQTGLLQQLARANIPTFTYSHAGLSEIPIIIRRLGDRVGRAREAAAVVDTIEKQLASIRARVAGRRRARTVIVFGRETGALRGIYASGGVGFIHDIVEIAGGTNVFADIKREAVQATTELILSRRPDVVLELRASLKPEEAAKESRAWSTLTAMPAVKAGRVYVLTDQRTVVPGPRIAAGAEVIARTLHPEAFK